jgi:hypothetical protein
LVQQVAVDESGDSGQGSGVIKNFANQGGEFTICQEVAAGSRAEEGLQLRGGSGFAPGKDNEVALVI